MGSAQRVVVAPAWAPRDVVIQHHLEFLSSWHPDFELEGSAVGRSYSSRAYFRKLHHVLRNAPVHLGGQLGIVDVPPELCELVHLVVPPVLSTCPVHTNSGCEKERRILIGPW